MNDQESLEVALHQLAVAEAAFDDADRRIDAAVEQREAAERRIAAAEQRLISGEITTLRDLAAKARYLARFVGGRHDKGMIDDHALTTLVAGVVHLECQAQAAGVQL